MNCKENHKYLDAYLDGELEPSLMLEVDTHLEKCDGCQSLVIVKRRLISALLEMGTIKAPDHLKRRIEFMRGGGNRFRNRIIAAAVPVAAAASFLVIFAVNRAPAGEEQLAQVVDDVVARHSVELPMEIKGPDASQAASWFRGKVDFPVHAPSLNIQQASFEGARLSNVREHQAAHMAYNVEGHRVTLMIFNRQNSLFDGGRHVQVDGKEVVLGQRNGFNVAVVLEGDMAYALSSDLSQDRLLTLARQMKI
jgi:anti-sigma factor RsiW